MKSIILLLLSAVITFGAAPEQIQIEDLSERSIPGTNDYLASSYNRETKKLTLGNMYRGLLLNQYLHATNMPVLPLQGPTRLGLLGDSRIAGPSEQRKKQGWGYYITNGTDFPWIRWALITNCAFNNQTIEQSGDLYTNHMAKWKPAGGTNGVMFYGTGILNNWNIGSGNTNVFLSIMTNTWKAIKQDGWVLVCVTLIGTDIDGGTSGLARQRVMQMVNELMRSSDLVDYVVEAEDLFYYSTEWILPDYIEAVRYDFDDGIHPYAHKAKQVARLAVSTLFLPRRTTWQPPRNGLPSLELSLSLVPVGTIIRFFKGNIPDGDWYPPERWLECTGALITYSDSPFYGQNLPNITGDTTTRYIMKIR
jgi:hypothetical protein